MHSQRTCVRREAPLPNTSNRNRDPGLFVLLKHTCVCATSLTTGSLLLPHAISQQGHTPVCVTAHRSLSPQTVAVAVTTDSLTLKHTSARSQTVRHHKSTAGDIVTSAPCFCATHRRCMCNQNTTQETGSTTTDSWLLQHTCVCACAVTDCGRGSLFTRMCTHVRVCMCICAHVCRRLQHTSV